MINLKKDEQIEIKTEWNPPFKAEETLQERFKRHERHQQMLEKHKDAKALRRERHKAGWHKKPFPTNTLA